jgi:predicted CopG family antitoxin
MAVKTITIDMEAYELLSRQKKAGESFSQVIKAHFRPQPTVARFKQLIRTVKISEEALDRMEEVVRARKLSPARAAKL